MARTKSNPEVTALLRTIPIFSACTAKELASIAAIVKEVDFAAGRVICKEGDTGVGLHVIVEGETKVQIGGRTRRRLGAGSFFGEIALLDGGPRTATVVAETPVKALSIVIWDFKPMLKAQSTLALKMLEELCRRLRATNESSLTN
jgi:CRP/FNR family transcriptional regulator, cyclic AMP receptor protein